MNEAIIRQAFEAGQVSKYDDYEAWKEAEVVELTCNDCGKEVIRTEVDWLDIDGVTPYRCGACTIEAAAQR